MSDVLAFLTESFNLTDLAPPSVTNIDEELVLVDSTLGVLPHVEESMPLTLTFINPVPGPLVIEEELVDTWIITVDTGYSDNSFDLTSVYEAELGEVILGSIGTSFALTDTFSSFVDTAIPLIETLALCDYFLGYRILTNHFNIYSPIGD